MADTNEPTPSGDETPRPPASSGPEWVGRARRGGDILGVLLIVAVVAWIAADLVRGRGATLDYVILAVSALALMITGSNLVNPPRIRLDDGRFVFRLPLGGALNTPAVNVRRVELAARPGLLGFGERLCLQVEFKEPAGVEPAQLQETLKKNFEQHQAHLITDAFFTKEQLEDLARALRDG